MDGDATDPIDQEKAWITRDPARTVRWALEAHVSRRTHVVSLRTGASPSADVRTFILLLACSLTLAAGCSCTSNLGRNDSGPADGSFLNDAPGLDAPLDPSLDAPVSPGTDAPVSPDAPGLDAPVSPGTDAPSASDAPLRSCSLLLQDCGAGEGCYTGRALGETTAPVCYPVGSSTQGGPCEVQNDCAAGHICLAAGASGICYRFCQLGGGAPSCTAGYTCNDLGVFGVGYCEVSL